jgi:SAM-dependent methyltransferase
MRKLEFHAGGAKEKPEGAKRRREQNLKRSRGASAFMAAGLTESEERTPERLRAHYLVERELSERLRRAPREERPHLYTAVYDELFRRVPDHPQLRLKRARGLREETLFALRLLGRYVDPETVFLEIGPGDCALSLALAPRVRKVYAVDVSAEIVRGLELPENFELSLSDGRSIPVPRGSVTLAYSDQLMEHLHPDDALDQLGNIYEALAPGGSYICLTPNRLSGPHDISMYFDEEATGFHLKEYTTAELARAFRRAGFAGIKVLIGARGRYLSCPLFPVRWLEALLAALPRRLSRKISRSFPLRLVLGIRLLAVK